MYNNVCRDCNGIINDPDAKKCPNCGSNLESFQYTFSKDEIEERLKTESPEIILELEKCPMCGAHRTNKEKECPNCGFTYVPVGFRYKSSSYFEIGVDYISGLFDKQIRHLYIENDKVYGFLLIPIGLCLILTIFLCLCSISLFTSLFCSLIVSVIAFILIYNIFYKPFKIKEKEIFSKQEDYKLLLKKWLKLNEEKEESVHGAPDKSVHVGRFQRVGKNIYFYFEKGMLKYDPDFISIKDVIECSLDDECGGSVRTMGTIKNNTLEVVGRSVVGAALGGATGAIIGGLTAKKQSEQTETIIHNYVVNISINNPKNPLLRLEFGNNIENAREVYSTLQAMLSRL